MPYNRLSVREFITLKPIQYAHLVQLWTRQAAKEAVEKWRNPLTKPANLR